MIVKKSLPIKRGKFFTPDRIVTERNGQYWIYDSEPTLLDIKNYEILAIKADGIYTVEVVGFDRFYINTPQGIKHCIYGSYWVIGNYLVERLSDRTNLYDLDGFERWVILRKFDYGFTTGDDQLYFMSGNRLSIYHNDYLVHNYLLNNWKPYYIPQAINRDKIYFVSGTKFGWYNYQLNTSHTITQAADVIKVGANYLVVANKLGTTIYHPVTFDLLYSIPTSANNILIDDNILYLGCNMSCQIWQFQSWRHYPYLPSEDRNKIKALVLINQRKHYWCRDILQHILNFVI